MPAFSPSHLIAFGCPTYLLPDVPHSRPSKDAAPRSKAVRYTEKIIFLGAPVRIHVHAVSTVEKQTEKGGILRTVARGPLNTRVVHVYDVRPAPDNQEKSVVSDLIHIEARFPFQRYACNNARIAHQEMMANLPRALKAYRCGRGAFTTAL